MINTVEQNQQNSLDHLEDVWLFGYGSLIFKVDFPFLEQQPASIAGWARRFWQGSHDHRGTPELPGRVVTLIESPGEICEGMAYRVTPDTFKHLDYREKNGYLRFFAPLNFKVDNHSAAEGVVYVASPDNPAFLGEASLFSMASQIAHSHGLSGSNAEYLLTLVSALKGLDANDPHVFELAEAVRAILKNGS